MIKNLSLALLMGCALMSTSTMLSAEESDQKEHVQIGDRAKSVETRMEQLEKRAKMAALNPEKKSNVKAMKGLFAGKSVYFTSHPAAYQSPVAISYFGDTVELTDGSIWAVASSDRYKTASWYSTDVVIITPNHSWFSSYAFRLTNQNTGESAAVNLSLGPIAPAFGSIYTHWIKAVDYYYNTVYLEDGSVWYMSSFDGNIVNEWVAGDIVIVGVNDGWLSSSKPNVLINVAMLNFAAGSASF